MVRSVPHLLVKYFKENTTAGNKAKGMSFTLGISGHKHSKNMCYAARPPTKASRVT